MTLNEVAVLILVAAACGFLAQAVVGFTRGGWLLSVILGFLGALLGGWMAQELRFPAVFDMRIGDQDFPIFWAVIGAMAVAMIVGILTPSQRR